MCRQPPDLTVAQNRSPAMASRAFHPTTSSSPTKNTHYKIHGHHRQNVASHRTLQTSHSDCSRFPTLSHFPSCCCRRSVCSGETTPTNALPLCVRVCPFASQPAATHRRRSLTKLDMRVPVPDLGQANNDRASAVWAAREYKATV